jgi:hypothetical protein
MTKRVTKKAKVKREPEKGKSLTDICTKLSKNIEEVIKFQSSADRGYNGDKFQSEKPTYKHRAHTIEGVEERIEYSRELAVYNNYDIEKTYQEYFQLKELVEDEEDNENYTGGD